MKLQKLDAINEVLNQSQMTNVCGGTTTKTECSGAGTHNGVAYSTDAVRYISVSVADGNGGYTTEWQKTGGSYSGSDRDFSSYCG